LCALLEADDTVALDLLDQYPFQPIVKEVAAANHFKQVVQPKKAEHAPAITLFMKKLGGLPSCYRKKCRIFTNWIPASMSKKDQEHLYKEWINDQDHILNGLAYGYGLRIGPDKKCLVLCRNSFMNVLNLGRARWITLNSTKLVLGANKHKNVENKNTSARQ
jgi:hypothetical protein